MTYPGTQRRSQTALESSLIAQVMELERERDELMKALRHMLSDMTCIGDEWSDGSSVTNARNLLARYPK